MASVEAGTRTLSLNRDGATNAREKGFYASIMNTEC
jgi:hypothetical protein